MELSRENIFRVLAYDADTGIFTRKMILNSKQKIGEVVGSKDAKGYVIIRFAGKQYKAHRLAWLVIHGSWPKGEIDHINGEVSDNRITNLRDVPKSINQQNRRAVKGYYKDGNRWRAQIRANGKCFRLGCYGTEAEAHAAYLRAKEDYHVKARGE